MKKSDLKIFSTLFLFLFGYILLKYFFIGIKTVPSEVDSITYHIPIAQSILSGDFINPFYDIYFKYFPGASEGILALFIYFNIPLGLYNWLAIVCLFLTSIFLFLNVNENKPLAIIFAFTICTLNGVLRWSFVQTIDIWLVVFFSLTLSLLIKPRDSSLYYTILGIFTGMLVGSKHSGILFFIVMFSVFIYNFLKYLNIYRLTLFIIPLGVIGLFWYTRNYLVTGNPLYPIDSFLFPGIPEYPGFFVWQSIIYKPLSVFNALISEYMVWGLVIIVVPVIIGLKKYKEPENYNLVTKLAVLGVINLAIFLLLPSTMKYQTHVSVFRYAFPVFIPLVLVVFMFAISHKLEKILVLIALVSLLVLSSAPYHPKIVFIIIIPTLLLFARKETVKIINMFTHR